MCVCVYTCKHIHIYVYVYMYTHVYVYVDGLSAVMSLRVRDLGFVEIMAYKPKRGKVQG